jgi:hypothetical protein
MVVLLTGRTKFSAPNLFLAIHKALLSIVLFYLKFPTRSTGQNVCENGRHITSKSWTLQAVSDVYMLVDLLHM